MLPSSAAETRNESASMAMAIGAVSAWTRNPLTPNARNSEADPLAASAPLASTSRSRSTIVGRYAPSAASKNVVRTAASPETTRSCQ